MAKLKKLNPETGQYEEIVVSFGNGAISMKDSHLESGARAITTLAERAIEVIESSVVNTSGAVTTVSNSNNIVYKIENVKKDDVIIAVSGNATSGTIGTGTESLWSAITKEFHDNYTYCTYTWTADKDYDVIYVTAHIQHQETYGYSTLEYTVYNNRPSYKDEYIPTINDDDWDNNIKTLSSQKIHKVMGYAIEKAKESLSGGVWIALGDSYTVYAKKYFVALAEKYGMIYDGQGVVSSSICGDVGGNKGFSPFWKRMDNFIANYTGDGQTLNEVVYSAEDVKLITFMGGANDGFGKDTWLGSHTSMDTNYIYGSCNYMFKKLRENFPNATIICILQPANHSDSMNYTDDETAQVLGFKDLAEMQTWDIYSFGQYKMETKERAVKECAERFGIPIVDCIFDWYSQVNPTHRSLYWNTDKIHLTDLGSEKLTEKLEKKIIEVCGAV